MRLRIAPRPKPSRKKRRNKAVLFGIASAVYACIIFYLSSISNAPEMVQPLFLGFDKLAHFVEFGLFGGLLFLTFAYADWRPWDAPIAIALGVAYGIVDELHQATVPGRMSDPLDMSINAIGVLVVVFILAFLDHKMYPSFPPESEDF